MKVSCIVEGESGPGNGRRSGSLPSLALGPWKTKRPSARLKFHGLPRIPHELGTTCALSPLPLSVCCKIVVEIIYQAKSKKLIKINWNVVNFETRILKLFKRNPGWPFFGFFVLKWAPSQQPGQLPQTVFWALKNMKKAPVLKLLTYHIPPSESRPASSFRNLILSH